MIVTDTRCQICGAARLCEVEGFGALPRITSDCRSYPAGGALFVCLACDGVQKVPDEKWLREIAGIYADYEAYYQSGGEEQIVFDRATGGPRRRSDVIVANLIASKALTASGHALDVGCGNGATLTSMSAALPGWCLSGYELGNSALSRLVMIPRFEKLYTRSIDAIDRDFDLVTMVHSLEHFPSPLTALAQLVPVVGEGKIFVEVCNVDQNPFDILVADHLIHFSPATLEKLLRRAGFSPTSISTSWVAKEISLLAKFAELAEPGDALTVPYGESTYSRMKGYVEWLLRFRSVALNEAERGGPIGVFGTSIAATWLAPQIIDRITFFVDEDPNRIGREHLGLPVIHPSNIPKHSRVLLVLAPSVASAIASRLSDSGCELIMPPPLLV